METLQISFTEWINRRDGKNGGKEKKRRHEACLNMIENYFKSCRINGNVQINTINIPNHESVVKSIKSDNISQLCC